MEKGHGLGEPFALTRALQEAFKRTAPIFVFTHWHPAGPLPSGIAWIVLSMPPRLTEPPLNPAVGFFPYTGTDSATFAVERRSVEQIERARGRARARRHAAGETREGDLALCDWEYAARKLAEKRKSRPLALSSYVAVDSVQSDGSVLNGARPVLGGRVRRGEPRLPRLLGLHTRNASEEAVACLAGTDAVLVSLHQCRGPKTQRTAIELTELLGDRPAIILAENASEIGPFIDTAGIRKVAMTLSTRSCPPLPAQELDIVIRERLQHEQQFRWALPHEGLTKDEEALWRIAVGTWRALWRRLSCDQAADPLIRFREALADVRRREPSSADRFSLVDQLLRDLEATMRSAASERLELAVAAVSDTSSASPGTTTVLVTSAVDQSAMSATLTATPGARPYRVAVGRHVADTALKTGACVVVGYAGPRTLDAVIRLRPDRVTWVLDPVEAALAVRDAESQAWTLSRLSLEEASALINGYREALSTGVTEVAKPTGSDRTLLSTTREWHPPKTGGGEAMSFRDLELREEVLDPAPTAALSLADGSVLQVDRARRFDVVRLGDGTPRTIAADELQPGDQLLVVRGEYQRTLSELLLEDMDSSELKNEAEARRAWAVLCRAFAARSPLTSVQVAEQVCELGGKATPETVRSWLATGAASATPRDWRSFHAFATVLGVDLPAEAIRSMFNKIKRWRVAHRVRGREVIKLCRAAWFGRLPASDLARIEERWGLTVRDLVEGSRVVEVEGLSVASEAAS